MKKGISFFLLSLLFIAPGCKDSKETVNEYNLVPLPNQMTPQQGRFELNKKVSRLYTGGTKHCRQSHRAFGNNLRIVVRTNGQGAYRQSFHHFYNPRRHASGRIQIIRYPN